MAATIRARGIDPQPLRDLIEANRQDQVVTSYATFDDLVAYCRLSANPVGRLVLGVFEGRHTGPAAVVRRRLHRAAAGRALAGRGRGRRRRRVYLPPRTWTASASGRPSLRSPRAGPALRALMAFEVARARRLLDAGPPLVTSLRGWARLAVAGFVAGGHAALDAVADAGFDPHRRPAAAPRPTGWPVTPSPCSVPTALGGSSVNLDEAYARCEEITRRGPKLLLRHPAAAPRQAPGHVRPVRHRPPHRRHRRRRRAAPADKLAALALVRDQLRGITVDPAAAGERPRARRPGRRSPALPPPDAALDELIDGCEMDVAGHRYATFDDLVGYCRRVAGTVGRLSLGRLRVHRPGGAGAVLADALGVALQITNILRDIVEDRETMGRVYLPAEDLDRFGVAPTCPGPDDGLAALICFEAARAEEWYDGPGPAAHARPALPGLHGGHGRHLPPPARPHPRDPAAVLRGRVSLPGLAEGRRGRPRPDSGGRREQGPHVVVVGGGLAGMRRRPRLRRRRRRGDPARAPAPPRRAHLVVRARRPVDRQRPARVPALLHRLPGLPATASARPATSSCRTASTSRVVRARPRPAGPPRRPGCAATACPPRSTWPGRCCATGTCAEPTGSASGRAVLPCAGLDLDDPRPRHGDLRALARPPRPSRPGHRQPCGT